MPASIGNLVWRFENVLGRSMWEFSGHPEEPRFLIIGRSHRGRPVPAKALPAELFERLIPYGALTTLDRGEPAGIALALQAPDREAVDALMADERTGLCAFPGDRDPQLGLWRPALKRTATRPTRPSVRTHASAESVVLPAVHPGRCGEWADRWRFWVRLVEGANVQRAGARASADWLLVAQEHCWSRPSRP